MTYQNTIFKTLLIIGLLSGCKQKYDPPAVTTNVDILVVDGFINSSSTEPTFLRLSRTKKIQEGIDHNGELNARVSIEDVNGNTLYNFQESGEGNYDLIGLNLVSNEKYRLRINTSDGRQYLSDEVTVKDTPPIDSISWTRLDNGVMIYANTHDPHNDTKYYRWDYTETWDYTANYPTTYKYEDDIFKLRQPGEYVYECWTSKNSNTLLLGTSSKLSEDVIVGSPLRFIPLNAEEIGVKYSILLRQYALTKESFDYYQNLKKITEQLGSIFDAQPSQLGSNIHCISNPTEDVLGFLTASSQQTKRIFISNAAVLPWNFSYYCDDPHRIVSDSFDYYFNLIDYIPTDVIRGPPYGLIVAALGARNTCVDCRERGGSNVRPDFWQ